MQTGTVRFYNPREGYGFIERDGPGRDVFVHIRDVSDPSIESGDHVEFVVETSERGPRARKVTRNGR